MLPRRPDSAGKRLFTGSLDDLCLRFVDTRYWRGSDPPTETLGSLADVVAWCLESAVLDEADAAGLRAWASAHPAQAGQLYADIVEAREQLFLLFSSVVTAGSAARAGSQSLNALLADAPPRNSLAFSAGPCSWQLPALDPSFACMLAPVLWSAGDLLAGSRRDRIRQCANDKCRWLFLDDSKSGTRRWCSMSSCGNRAKAHRHYLKTKGAGDRSSDAGTEGA